MAVQAERRAGGAVLHLLLDAPKANIIDQAMMDGLEAALTEHVDAHIKAIVFEGAGRHFSFGASVEAHQRDQVAAMLKDFHGLFRRLAELAVPTCAVVRGYCLGGGMELAAWCSWVFAARDAHFGQPEIKLGVFPPLASVILPWRLGGGAAMDLCLSGRTIDAATALRMGLVTELADDPGAAWDAYYQEHLASLSASSLRFGERAVRRGALASVGAELDAVEALYVDELMATHDANEGIEAFMAKREARFEDR